MEACRGELSFEPRDLELTPIAVAELNGKSIGVAQIRVVDGEADLLKLFVEPKALRSGTGRQGATRLGYRRREKTGRDATNHRCGPGCRSVLPQDGSLWCRPSTVWFDTRQDAAETSDEPSPCGL